MPPSLLTVAITLALGTGALTMLVLLYLRYCDVSKRATSAWALAYACICGRYLCGLLGTTGWQWSPICANLFAVGFVSFFWFGTRLFVHLPSLNRQIWTCSGLVSILGIALFLMRPESTWSDLIVHTFCAILLFVSAYSFWRIHRSQQNLSYAILCVLISARGAILLCFPFFYSNGAVMTWGFVIASLTDLSIGMMLLVASIMCQQRKAEIALQAMETEMSVRKHAEDVLTERKALFEKVFQLVPVTLTVTRMRDGYYIDVNRHWKSLSGWSRDEVIGITSADINLWADVEQRNKLVELIQRDGEVREMQIAFRHQDGHIFQCRVSASKFESENETYLLIASQNIEQELATEKARTNAERLLRENEYKYSTIFQLSPIALGLVNFDTQRIIEVNDVWLSQFGFQRNDVIGYTATEMAFWDRPEERSEMIKTLSREGRLDRFEIRHRRQDGQVLICLMSARLFNMSGDKVFIFSLHDVTRQYQVEQEIREMATQLEARVRLRTLKLEQTNIELAAAMESLKHTQDELIRAEKMAALGSLVAGVAHELNTPIGNSVTVASTLQDKTKELLQDMLEGKLRRSVLDEYLQSASVGTALLMKTLGIARELIRSFKQVAVDQSSNQRRRFDLKTSLEEVVTTLTPMLNKSAFSITTDLSPGIVMDSFPGPLGQIMTNFMSNSLSHGFEGRERGEMTISSRLIDDAHVEIIFRDDGIGIPESYQKRVFDPFFTTKLGQGGSGLGMHIVYNLVNDVLGGSIHLDSEVGVGTTFYISLPLSAPALSVESESTAVII